MPYIIVILLVLLFIYIIITRNKLLILKNKVKDCWANIDVQLKKRVDLIPNLVEVVKSYVNHEEKTFENIVSLRNKFNNTEKVADEINTNNEIVKSLNKLFALSESYPELKSNVNFLSLQRDLKDIEDKIASYRQSYNESILNYNNKVEVFPNNIVAFLLGFKKETFFDIDDYERKAPKIIF